MAMLISQTCSSRNFRKPNEGSTESTLFLFRRWWWHSTEEWPADVGAEQIHYELNADFDTSLMDAEDVQALVAAWQMGAISRDTLLHNFRQGEILPPGRTNEQELEKIRAEGSPQPTVLQKVAP